MRDQRGFTLLELMITMTLFIIVIAITGNAFNSILTNTRKLSASEESNIEGIVGLEVFRHDLRQMGTGLAGDFCLESQKVGGVCPNLPVYKEALVAPASSLNDAPSNVPRQFVTMNNYSGAAVANSTSGSDTYRVVSGSDYLSIKGVALGRSKASQKWTYLNFSTGGKPPKTWTNAADNIPASSRVIMLSRVFNTVGSVTSLNNVLVYDKSSATARETYWVNYPAATDGLFPTAFSPVEKNQSFTVYGVDDGNLGMPFNRSDYFVSRPSDQTKIPKTCAPGTGILYKANINHADGKLNYMPILDCVADMQVVYGWDFNGTGVYDESSAYEGTATNLVVSGTATKDQVKAAMENPAAIRDQLKYIKVYIMAQDGRIDPGFRNRSDIVVGDLQTLTSGYTVAALTAKGWLNYRWKIYRINIKNPTAN